MEKLDGKSLDIREDSIEKLKKLFPEIITEGEQINFEKLKAILTDELDESNEKYTFTWNGKSEAMRIANTPTTGTLKPVFDKSKEWDNTENIYIEGDNLEVLKLMLKSYVNKIKIIYIDPPYNTGNDFVYDDDFSDNLENYFIQTGQIDNEGYKLSTNQESNGRFHSNWLNMMYPRLRVARNLMRNDGVIFISIDDNEYPNLKKICDEIFGEKNYVSTLAWEKKKKPSFLNKNIGSKYEFILIYAKDRTKTHEFSIERTTMGKKYPFNNAGNSPKTLVFPPNSITFTSIDNQIIKAQDMSSGNIVTELLNDVIIKDGKNKNEVKLYGEWRYSQEKLDEFIEEESEITVSAIPFRPNLTKKGGEIKKMHNLFTSNHYNIPANEDATKEFVDLMGNTYFEYTKPMLLIKQLIKSYTYNDKNALVMDFFSGSGTLGHAVMELNHEDKGNRQYIMVQIPEKLDVDSKAYNDGYNSITDIAIERINRAGDKIVKENSNVEGTLDIGFKYFKLDKSNIKKWNIDEENIEEELLLFTDNFEEGSTHDDIVYELLLKQGIELTVPIEKETFADTSIYIIANGAMFVVIGNNIDESIGEYIRDYESLFNQDEDTEIVVAFQDIGFEDDSAKLNTFEILKSAGFKDENIFTV